MLLNSWGRLDGRDASDGFEQAADIESVHPFRGCVFDGLKAAPRATTMDDFGREEAVDRLGQGIVKAVSDAVDPRFDACLGQMFGAFDGQISRSAAPMMHQPHALDETSFVGNLFECFEHEPGRRGGADPPADDAPGTGINDEK